MIMCLHTHALALSSMIDDPIDPRVVANPEVADPSTAVPPHFT